MELINRIVKSNENIHNSNLDLIQKVENIYQLLQRNSECQLCKKSSQKEEKLIHKEDVLEYLKISLSTYHRFKRKKILIPVKIGKRDYFHESALLELLAERKKKRRY